MDKAGPEEIMTVTSSNNSEDSGYENGFLEDGSTSSESSGCYQRTSEFSGPSERKSSFPNNHYKCCVETYDISGLCIETFSPKTFQYYAHHLIELNLSKNNISSLPETIVELKNLKVLNLSQNKFASIPESWKVLDRLKVFNVSNNKLTEIPQCLACGMGRLNVIDLSHNAISSWTKPPLCLPFLLELRLINNVFETLPLWLFSDQCRSLKDLDVSLNFCFDDPKLPTNIVVSKHYRTSLLKNLKKLNISNTGSKLDMIACLSHFEALEVLHMGNVESKSITFNSFLDLSMNLFSNPLNITELYLSNVDLAGLPSDFCKLQNIRVLDLSQNNLDWLPDSFGLLRNLEELMLSHCNLVYLPDNFNQLSCLTKLLLNCNRLTDVRGNLSGLTSLQWLDLYDNLLEEFPVAPDVLTSHQLEALDVASNYIDVAESKVLDDTLRPLYYQLQDNLRGSDPNNSGRSTCCKINKHSSDFGSSESLYHKSSLGDDELSASDYIDDAELVCEAVKEENWDEEPDCYEDCFDPNTVERFSLPPGKYKFGWTPPFRHRECIVPTTLHVTGFIYIPGQVHTKTSRRRRVKVDDLPVVEGQFDADDSVAKSDDVEPGVVFWAKLKSSFMFIRNPRGPKHKRCRLCSPFEDCWHHGVWIRF